jgi:hypothetical protein
MELSTWAKWPALRCWHSSHEVVGSKPHLHSVQQAATCQADLLDFWRMVQSFRSLYFNILFWYCISRARHGNRGYLDTYVPYSGMGSATPGLRPSPHFWKTHFVPSWRSLVKSPIPITSKLQKKLFCTCLIEPNLWYIAFTIFAPTNDTSSSIINCNCSYWLINLPSILVDSFPRLKSDW